MKEWNEKERWALAAKLDQILGADLMPDEEDAIHDAIRLICPQFADAMEQDLLDAAEGYDKMMEEEKNSPPSFNGKILRFGKKDEDGGKH